MAWRRLRRRDEGVDGHHLVDGRVLLRVQGQLVVDLLRLLERLRVDGDRVAGDLEARG